MKYDYIFPDNSLVQAMLKGDQMTPGKFLSILILLVSLISACVPKNSSTPFDVVNFMYVEGIVLSADKNMATIRIDIPIPAVTPDSFEERIVQSIVEKSLLVEGIKSEIQEKEFTVVDKRKNIIICQFHKSHGLKSNEPVKIYAPKLTIAITDFTVLKGNSMIGALSLDKITNIMVNSGQFNIVEREKIQTVLKELKLGLTGLSDSKTSKKIGQLLQADFVLTGTLSNLSKFWEVHLRLVNVQTGLIVGAFKEIADFKDFHPDSVRDISNINESLEGKRAPGWVAKKGVSFKSATKGANGTETCAGLSFKLQDDSFFNLVNLKKRDLSQFQGIEFFAKSDIDINAVIKVADENRNDHSKQDHWFATFQVRNEWKKYRIRFEELSLSPRFARKKPGGDGILNLDLISDFVFSVTTNHNEKGLSGTLWIDEIAFY